jgi:hypothetical protein
LEKCRDYFYLYSLIKKINTVMAAKAADAPRIVFILYSSQ